LPKKQSVKISSDDRLAALEKALLLSKLFEPANFKDGTTLINKEGDEGKEAFKLLCKGKLGKETKDWEWLWQALKKAKEEQKRAEAGGLGTGW
jgi:hypothetical protein